MAVLCPNCGNAYDITLFEFGHTVTCDCGAVIDPFKSDPRIQNSFIREEPPAVELPIDGVLDLHTFQPRDVKDLVADYLAACREKGISRIRIIHGKGRGSLLRTVQAILKKRTYVESFELAGADEGGWGATIVRLKR